MTLTRFQIHERLGCLKGELKAARENKRGTSATVADAEKALALALQADEKADGHITRLESEARDLADQYVKSVDELLGDGEAPETTHAPVFAGFGSSLYSNGSEQAVDAAVTAAFERATNP